MLVVGVTGGIGAGKSTVSGMFARLGAQVLDADAIAREVVGDDVHVLQELQQAFGQDILGPDGSLDRRELGRRAFRETASRRRLDDILHPPILARTRQLLDQARRSGRHDIIVLDAALLVECRTLGMVDRLVVVEAPLEIRQQRVKKDRGLSAEEFEARAAAQLPGEEKSRLADYVISNDSTIEELSKRVRQVWQRLQAEAAGTPEPFG
jgi:dephospho-CoA kinase